ncbi:MAG: type II secretion system F family protein [Candidatus Micrarchaeaceae archaeon]
MKINFERLVSRNVSLSIYKQLSLAGMKMTVNKFISIIVIFGIAALVIVSTFLFILLNLPLLIAIAIGIGSWALIAIVAYMIVQYKIDGRKTKMERLLADYFQLAAANLRSGIALDRALLIAARPEFGFFSDDIKDMSRKVFAGETLENTLTELGQKYRSTELQRAVRMMIESIRYGGAMADLLVQLSKDMRAEELAKKEISGQMLMYTIFIVFAGLIAAPLLYGLTSQMIVVTDNVWTGILKQNPGGLPTAGISFLKPSPPKITTAEYKDFSIVAIIVVTGFASLIMAAISSGSPIKGLKYLPLFILAGIGIYFVTSYVIGLMFSSIGGA